MVPSPCDHRRSVFAYNQQQQILTLNNELAKANAQIQALQKPPQKPHIERPAGPPGSGNQSPWGKAGNPLETSTQGNVGGGKGRH